MLNEILIIGTLISQKMSSLITTGTSNGGLDPNHLKSASESSFRWVLGWPLMESIMNSFILEYDLWDIKKYRKCWESDHSKVWAMSNEKYWQNIVLNLLKSENIWRDNCPENRHYFARKSQTRNTLTH